MYEILLVPDTIFYEIHRDFNTKGYILGYTIHSVVVKKLNDNRVFTNGKSENMKYIFSCDTK